MSHTPKIPKEFTPGFSLTEKPTIPVVIDRSHPITRGMRAAFVFSMPGVSKQWDIWNERFADITNGEGQGVYAGRSSYYFNDSASEKIDLSYIGNFSGSSKISVYSRMYYNNNAIDHALIDFNGQLLVFWADTSAGNLSPGGFAGLSRPGASGLLSGPAWVSWGACGDRSVSTSTIADYYVNGTIDVSAENIGTVDWTGTSNIAIANRWSGSDISAKESDAYYEYFYLWDRKLSPEEFKSINDEPYQILKPAIDVTYFYPSAATTSAPYVLPKEFTPGFSITRKPTGAVALEKRGDAWMFNMGYPSINGDTPSSIPASSFFGVSDDAYYANTGFNQALTYSGGVIYGDMHCLIYDVTIDRATVTSSTSSYVWVVIGDFRVQIGSNTGFMTGETITYYDNTDTAKKSGVAYDLTDGVRYVIVFRFNGSNYDIFINGQEITPLSSSSEVNAIISASGTNEIYSYHGVSAPQQLNHFVCAITEPVSKAEAISLSKAPYQILKPAIDVTYIFSGAASGSFTITADSGVYTITGTVAGIEKGSNLPADSGTYTYTGTAVDLPYGFRVQVDSGAYTYSGTTVSLTAGFNLAADSGSYTYTGTAATVARDGTLAANSGSYTYTGTDATLTFESPGSFTLSANNGTYTYSGAAAGVEAGLISAADSGTYTYSGTAASLDRGYTISANSGTYTYSGTTVDFGQVYVLGVQSGSYIYTGASNLLQSRGIVWTVQTNDDSIWTVQTLDDSIWTVL